MKLKPKARADRPNPTAYTLSIGSAEAREAGLIGNKGELYEVEKTVKDGVLVVTRKGREEAPGLERIEEFARKYMREGGMAWSRTLPGKPSGC